jgi:hypothetical protein
MPTYTNLIILQGWLEIETIRAVVTDRLPVAVINGWIYTTDTNGLESVFGEQHPVVISGRPAEAVLDITRKLMDKHPRLTGISLVHLSGEPIDQTQILVNQGRPYVIAQGKLLTHAGQSCVDIKHISVLGLPWGALDALEELETVMDDDVRSLLEALSPQEKYQMNQALGTAMRAILALRLSCLNGKQECSI